MQAPVTEPSPFPGDGLHALAQRGVILACGFVSHGHAAKAGGFTRPPFAHPMGAHEVGDSSPLGSGRHHFFPKRSFSATLSSIASANMRFSLAFSSSSAFSRLASDTSIPPKRAFHL